MRQMVFAYVLIQGWTIDSYEHWFFYQPGEVLLLPTHYAEISKWGSMTWGVAVVMYGGGGLQMLFIPLSKCSWCFSNILLITFQPIKFEPIDYTTLFVMWSLSFGVTNSSFKVFPLLKCTWMPYFWPMFLKLSLSPLLYGTVMEILLMLFLLVNHTIFTNIVWLTHYYTEQRTSAPIKTNWMKN